MRMFDALSIAPHDEEMKRKNKAAQLMAKARNKKYGKQWLKENARKMVAGRKARKASGEIDG